MTSTISVALEDRVGDETDVAFVFFLLAGGLAAGQVRGVQPHHHALPHRRLGEGLFDDGINLVPLGLYLLHQDLACDLDGEVDKLLLGLGDDLLLELL